MNGRQENDFKIDSEISRLVDGSYNILKLYSYSFTNKTHQTKRSYIYNILRYLNYLDKNGYYVDDYSEFKNIKPVDVNRYIQEEIKFDKNHIVVKERSASTVTKHIAALHNFFEFLVDNEIIDRNPCEKIEKPKQSSDKEVVSLTTREVKKIKRNIEDGVLKNNIKRKNDKFVNRDLAIISLACSTGLRVGAISQINIQDINTKDHSISVYEKGNKKRDIYIGANTMSDIQKWMNDRDKMFNGKYKRCDALFISNVRTRITTVAIGDIVKKYSGGIDKKISTHKLRSTCATNLYEKTGDIYLVQNVLGHKNVATTQRYANVSTEKRKKAADILDNLF